MPFSEFACALMYFTGSAHFNRSMRNLAARMNMSLNEHALYSGVIRRVCNYWIFLHADCVCFPGCYTYTICLIRIDAFLRRAYKCGISKDFQDLLHDSGAMLFKKMQSSTHCLNTLLPPKKTIDYVLRNSDTSYVLPQCSLNVFKRSFINWCLFKLWYITIVT